jgi:predicted nucleic acid-binding protein
VNGSICFDASVVVKWLILEDHSELALALLGKVLRDGSAIVGPPHLPVEVTSALYKRVRAGELTLEEAQHRTSDFSEIPIDLVYSDDLSRNALALSLEFGWKHPYDAFYLAVGELLKCEVWTADVAFQSDAIERYPRIRLLRDYVPS